MAVERITIARTDVEDSPGSGHKLLAELGSAGVDLRAVAAFSAGGGRSSVLLAPKDPAALSNYGGKAKMEMMTGFLTALPDAAGAGAEAIKPLADAGVNIRALTAVVCDGNFHLLIVVDNADADKAAAALQ